MEVRGAVWRSGWGELYRGEESCMEERVAVWRSGWEGTVWW